MVKKINQEYMPWQWKTMEYLSYLLVFLVPLYLNSNSLFVYNPSKVIISIFLILTMGVLYSWGKLVEKKLSFRFTPLHIVSLIFLLILSVSSMLGVDPLNSFFGRWRDGISLVLIYFFMVFSLFIGYLINKDKTFLVKIISVSFVSSFIVALISYTGSSLLDIFKDGASTIGNSSYTGAYLLFNVCFGIGLFFYYSKVWQKILVAIGTLFVATSPVFFNTAVLLGKIKLTTIIHNPFILFGQANAATIGLGVSFIVIIIFFLIFSSKKVIKIIGVVLFTSLLIGVFYTGNQLVNPDSSLHKVYIGTKGENRFVAWDIAEISFGTHPLLGSGFNNYSYNYQKYFSSDITKEKNPELYFLQPHNIILEYLSNNGVIGLISYFALLFVTFFAFFERNENENKKDRIIKIVLIGSLFGYLIQNLFGFDTPTSYLMLFLVVGVAVGLYKKEWICVINNKKINAFKIFPAIILVISLLSIILFVILPIKEISMWNKSTRTDNTKERISLRNNMQTVSLFGGVYDSADIESKSYDLYANSLSKINDKNRSLYIEEIQSATDQLDKDIERQPNEVRAYVAISQLLNLEIYINGKMDETLWNKSYENIKKALSLNSQNPEIYSLLAQTYLLKQDFKNAYLAMHQALEIAPQYVKSYEYAKQILKIKPDANFKNYLDKMEQKWLRGAVTN